MNLKNKMKWILLIVFLVILLMSGSLLIYTAYKEKNKAFKEITYAEFKQKLDQKETFFFVATQTGCPHCEKYRPVVEEVLKEHKEVKGYEINIRHLSDEELNALVSVFNFDGTPVTIFIHDGVETTTLNRGDGALTKSELLEKLNDLGYIKEGRE